MPVQDMVSMVASIVAAVGVIIVLPWWLRGKFAAIDLRFSQVEARLSHLESGLRGLSRIISTLIGILIRTQVVKPEDAAVLIKESIGFGPILGASVERLGPGENPVTQEEVDRIKRYVRKVQEAQVFTPQEAEDFYRLSRKASEGRSEEGLWLLEMVAAFVFGYYLARRL